MFGVSRSQNASCSFHEVLLGILTNPNGHVIVDVNSLSGSQLRFLMFNKQHLPLTCKHRNGGSTNGDDFMTQEWWDFVHFFFYQVAAASSHRSTWCFRRPKPKPQCFRCELSVSERVSKKNMVILHTQHGK